MTSPPKQYHFWHNAIAGLCSILIALGLCRFAYTPLIPAMIQQGWVTKAGAGYLGMINFLGYLMGAYLAMQAGKYFSIPKLINVNLAISIVSLALCAINLGFGWLAIWRCIAGVTGGLLMVLTPAVILKTVPLPYRGRAAGLIFTGLGVGTIVAGLAFPVLANIHVSLSWLGMALFALSTTAFAWPVFSSLTSHTPATVTAIPVHAEQPWQSQRLFFILLIAYAFYGIGIVPHSLFLIDYVHQQLGLSTVASGMFWSLFGFGALLGPFSAGLIADRVGIYKSLIGAYLLCIISIAMVLFNHIAALYALSAFLMGMLLPSVVTLVSSRIAELVGTGAHPKFWGKMTLCFGISQSAAAYFMSFLLQHGVSYTSCFAIADLAFLFGIAFIVFTKTAAK